MHTANIWHALEFTFFILGRVTLFSCKGYLIYLPHFYIFLEHQTGDGSTFHKDDTKPTLKLLQFKCLIKDNYVSIELAAVSMYCVVMLPETEYG